MGKQGLMVFYIDVGNVSPHKAISHVNDIKDNMLKTDSWELKENYELVFLSQKNNVLYGTRIEVFPYKDYKFNIQDMTCGEIENYIEQQVLSKLQAP